MDSKPELKEGQIEKVEDASSDSEYEAPGLEGELTEEQKRVSEAAGLSADQVNKDSKHRQFEKKARELFSIPALELVSSLSRGRIWDASRVAYSVEEIGLFKRPGSDTYIVFGEAKIEDLSHHTPTPLATLPDHEQEGAAEDGLMEDRIEMVEWLSHPSVTREWAVWALQHTKTTWAAIDLLRLEEMDIELVMSQANASRDKAILALRQSDKDIEGAIMTLTM